MVSLDNGGRWAEKKSGGPMGGAGRGLIALQRPAGSKNSGDLVERKEKRRGAVEEGK